MTTSDETAPFCHDNYEHPLLWCGEKKRLVERKNAEESLRMWRRRKTEENARKERDKQEYFELTVKHCPWGRPGGGAPNVDVRRKDITAVGLHSTPSIAAAHRLSSMQPCRYSDYFSQRKKCHDPLGPYHAHTHHHHHHQAIAPRLTHAHTVHHHLSDLRPGGGSNTVTICERDIELGPRHGGVGHHHGPPKNGESLQITLKEHPSMSFRNKGHVDIEVRYKPVVPGKPLLEKIVVTETDKCPIVAPPPPTVAITSVSPPGAMKAGGLLSPCKKPPKALIRGSEKPPSKDPWGRPGPGGKPWRSPKAVGSSFMKSMGWTNKEMLKELDQDNPVTPAEKQTFRKPARPARKQRCCDVCICTCPTIIASPHKPLLKKTIHCGTQLPGASTRTEITAKICPRLTQRCGAAAPSADTCGNPPTTSEMSTAHLPGGGVELVPLLARRRAAHSNRPLSLSSTDVTKRTASNDRLSTAVDLHYLHDLNMQMTEKRRSISVSQQVEREECQQHFETFDTYWGRPGNGAPGKVNTKLKLDNLLYGNQGCTSE